MRVLMLSCSLPCPVESGRAYSLLKALSKRHKVILLCASERGPRSCGRHAELESLCERIEPLQRSVPQSILHCVRCFGSGGPLGVLWFDSEKLRRRVIEIAENEEVDAVVAAGCRMASYLSDVRGVPSVLDLADCTSMLLSRAREFGDLRGKLVAAMEGRRQEVFEAGVWRAANVCTVSSESQRERLQRLSGCSFLNVHVLPNSVDLEGLESSPSEMALRGRVLLTINGRDMAGRDAARYFLREIWPRVAREVPWAHLVVADWTCPGGSGRSEGANRVTYLESPADIRMEILKAEVVVYPMRTGPGSRDGILRSMAMRRAVVSSSLGADGLDVVHGRHLLVADSADRFCDSVRALLEDPDLAVDLAEEGSSLVRRRHSLENMEERFNGILSSFQPCLQEIYRL